LRRCILIAVLWVLVAGAAAPALAATATLKLIFTRNGMPLEDPTRGKFYVYEPGQRAKYVAWGHGDKVARFPEGTYDLVIRYEYGEVSQEFVREGVELTGDTEEEVDFTVQVARLNVQVTAGGEPVEPHVARYDVYPSGRRGRPVCSGRPGTASILPPGLYDIVATVIDSRGQQTFEADGVDVQGVRDEVIEIGEPPARLALTMLRDGSPLSSTQGRWRVYRAGTRSRYLVERGSGETADLEPGTYDIDLFYREGLHTTERWLERVHVAGVVTREIEVTEEPTQVRVEIGWRGSPLDGAWFTVHRVGDREHTLVTGDSGDTVSLTPGRYDFGCFFRDGGLRGETWIEDREVAGPVDLYAEIDPRPTTMRVLPPRRSRGDTVRPSVLVLLDSSLDMGKEVGGRSLLELATQGIEDVFGGSNVSNLRLAVRAWGIAPRARRDCNDSGLVLPFGPVSGERLSSTLKLLRPTGFSPIADSLKRVADDLPADGGNTLVIVTGSIDTCGGDPCAEATRLLRSGVVDQIQVVGLDLDRKQRQRFECLGRVQAADSRRSLRSVLRVVLNRAAATADGSVSVFEPGWDVWVAGGALGEEIPLSRGTYDIIVRSRGTTWLWDDVRITSAFESPAGARPSPR